MSVAFRQLPQLARILWGGGGGGCFRNFHFSHQFQKIFFGVEDGVGSMPRPLYRVLATYMLWKPSSSGPSYAPGAMVGELVRACPNDRRLAIALGSQKRCPYKAGLKGSIEPQLSFGAESSQKLTK